MNGYDPVRDEQIRNGLRVTAWRAGSIGRVVSAYRTQSDIYAFQGLPGLRDLEYGVTQTDPPLSSPPAQLRFVMLVEDALRRYLPVAQAIDLPLAYEGVFPRNGVQRPPDPSPPGFLLFSAVSRPRPSWLAGIRGELWDWVNGQPAAHAKVQVRIAGREVYGLSDADGRFVIYLPYPSIAEDLVGSPPPSLGFGSIFKESWIVELRLFYQPYQQTALPRTALPDYLSVITQPLARVWIQSPTVDASPAGVWTGELYYGRELYVTTTGEKRLLVSPAVFSP